MPKILNQKGFAPIIFIIAVVIAITGVVVVKKDLFIKSDRSTETIGSQTPDQSPAAKAAVSADAKGGLANKPFEVKIEKEGDTLVGPQFSITPPAGWTIKPTSGNSRVLFEAPKEDESAEGLAYFNLFANVGVHIAPALGKTLEDILPSSKNNFQASGIEDITTEKTKFNGEDTYYFEGIIYLGKTGAKEFEAQLRSEIKKANKKVPEADIQKGVKFIADNYKVKLFGYIIIKDGYTVTITGKALTTFWDKRFPQLKASIDTFKFLPKITE